MTKRHTDGRWRSGSSGNPAGSPLGNLTGVVAEKKLTQGVVAAFRRARVDKWVTGLPPTHKRHVEERVVELTRGLFIDLPPTERANVRGIARDEILMSVLESEVLMPPHRKLVHKTTGKVRGWVEVLVKLEESLARRRRDLEKMLREMEPKPANPLAAYLASRNSGPEAFETEPESPGGAESPFLEADDSEGPTDEDEASAVEPEREPADSGVSPQAGERE